MQEAQEPPVTAQVPGVVQEGDRTRWMEAVEETLDAIRAGHISKAVLARTRDVELEHQHASTHAFLFEPRPGQVLLGAAPEALATLRDGIVTATAVAGSVRRGSDPREDEVLARELLESRKDRAEHRVVVEDMVTRLEPLAAPQRTRSIPSTPRRMPTSEMC